MRKKLDLVKPLIVAVFFAAVATLFSGCDYYFGTGAKGVIKNYEKRERAKGFCAGKFLAGNAETKGKKLLIINSAGSKDNRYTQMLNNALKEQYGSLEADEVKDNSPEGDFIAPKAKDIEEVLARHPGMEVVAFKDTLPEDYSRLKIGKIFLFNTGSADTKQVMKDIKSGKIVGVIFTIKGVRIKSTDKVENDPEEAFKKRYILIDKSNVDANASYFN